MFNHQRMLLLEEITKIRREELIAEPTKIPKKINSFYLKALAEANKGKPIEYILNTAWFWDLKLSIKRGVFIPRPETEELVEKIVNQGIYPKLIFEVGTGTAAIAIVLARHYKNCTVYATDISKNALKVADINIKRYGLESRIKLYRASLFNIPNKEKLKNKLDLIVSNPPYIPTSRLDKLPKEVKDYEHRLALNGGKDGFRIAEKIILQGLELLNPKGIIALEIDPSHLTSIKKLEASMPQLKFKIEKDLSKKERFLFISYANRNNL